MTHSVGKPFRLDVGDCFDKSIFGCDVVPVKFLSFFIRLEKQPSRKVVVIITLASFISCGMAYAAVDSAWSSIRAHA